ncbi:hypothetical protein CC1G_09074 [Coprinopsis cinerea okayama7|uniref:Uncharacterized protein n=1 Tax=Coprinopsis cinerea (strain Okayama-7 / 130 / ATCC MYA-4618 / FGSC 9003) TaxID=240176 RepID=A8P314_COPC7|nr:hypothetical protein CC1G_09074 [Coprinopsis cinerea okayama7\|eukprot:XP_001838446.2 hypothetical protein CC1G_09074 [Coprinopsis cinerea okayama7\
MTAIRETREETGLKVERVLGVFDGFEYTTKKGVNIQFNLVVQVECGAEETEPRVTLNPLEHDHHVWVDPSDDFVSMYPMSETVDIWTP